MVGIFRAKNGYAIGFGPQHFRMAYEQGFRLVRCVYKEEEQEALAQNIIDGFCRVRDEGKDLSVDDDEDAASVTAFAAAAMKHPGFEREAEWRLIKPLVMGFEPEAVCFREGRSGIVPYLKIPLARDGEQFRPEIIYLGPNDDMNAATKAMETLLYQGHFQLFKDEAKTVLVVPSKTPYRP